MEDTKYEKFVLGLLKPGEQIKEQMTPSDAHLWHMGTLVAGEGAELLDAIKKAVVYRKPIDMHNVVEELGDIEFGLAALRHHFNLQREEILAQNHEKLSKRYKLGVYSNIAAIERADKK